MGTEFLGVIAQWQTSQSYLTVRQQLIRLWWLCQYTCGWIKTMAIIWQPCDTMVVIMVPPKGMVCMHDVGGWKKDH